MTRIKGWSRETDFRTETRLSAQDVALKLWLKLPAAFAAATYPICCGCRATQLWKI
jgi:hypothetical protein